MVAQSLLDSVFALPAEDRLDLLCRLSDNLRGDPATSPLSDAHRAILDARLADLKADPGGGSSWDDVARRVGRALDRA